MNDEYEKQGLPRPLAFWSGREILVSRGGREEYWLKQEGRKLPVPWLSSDYIDEGQWTKFNKEKLHECFEKSLCSVCGLETGEMKVFGHAREFERIDGKFVDTFPDDLTTDGPGMHVRCALLAANYCPYFTRQLTSVQADELFILWKGADCGLCPEDIQQYPKRVIFRIREGSTPLSLQQLKELVRAEKKSQKSKSCSIKEQVIAS
jgi:hypothetical protein